MKNRYKTFNIKALLLSCIGMILFIACQDDNKVYEKTRLFSPVLSSSEGLTSVDNTIIVNLAKLKEAIGYKVEISRDSFKTAPEYVIESDTNYVVVDEATVNESLFWSTLYQVRVTAYASNSKYDSKISDLGNVRTQRFPTILNVPKSFDVTDIEARVTWLPQGEQVTGIKVFSDTDLRLQNPLLPEQSVSAAQHAAGEVVVTGLAPDTAYQIAIYSSGKLRGWVNYNTKTADIDPNGPNVIDVRADTSADAVINALATAPEGATILVKRGMEYNAPSQQIDKSLTIRAAYGFGEQKARLLFAGNFDVVDGSTVDHLRFVDLELRGTDWTGKYVMNLSKSATLNEMSFEGCYITNFRGICRQKDNPSTINTYSINNCVIDSIGGYGLATVDKDVATLKNFSLTNSSVNHTIYFIVSKNNFETLNISDCTIVNSPETGRQLLRFRQGGQDNVTGGINISNTIMGHTWDQSNSENYGMKGIEGLASTTFNLLNNYSTNDFSFTSDEIPGFPVGNYNGSQSDLWMDAENSMFNFKDSSFPGRYDSGDPRWRDKI